MELYVTEQEKDTALKLSNGDHSKYIEIIYHVVGCKKLHGSCQHPNPLEFCDQETEKRFNNEFEIMMKPKEVVEGIHTCLKCNSKQTSSYFLQTRSIDEPMTEFITCVKCSANWRM